jgi:hypothetical protein
MILRTTWEDGVIVGAVAQHAPEDVPNFYKQRGTWAIDTVRLILWRRLKGLSLRQKAQFSGTSRICCPSWSASRSGCSS